MKRRQFIGAAAAGTAAVSGASCATLGQVLTEGRGMTEGEIDGFLAKLERGLRYIAEGDAIIGPPRSEEPQERARHAGADALARRSLRALLLTAMVQDLDPVDRQHPRVRQKVLEHAPELDEAVVGMDRYLASLGPQEHGNLQRVLRAVPDAGTRIAEGLDRPAREAGVPLSARLKTRAMLSHVAWRMRVQDPGLALGEYRDKVGRMATRSGPAEHIRRVMATQMSADAFWRHQDRLARLYASNTDTEEPGAPASAPTSAPTAAPIVAPAWAPTLAPAARSAEGPCAAECQAEHSRLCVKMSNGQCVECTEDAHCQANPAALGSRCHALRCYCSEEEIEKRYGGCRRLPIDTDTDEDAAEKTSARGKRVMIVGGCLGGSGALVLGVGGIIVGTTTSVSSSWLAGAIMMTVGGLLLLAGLITLAIGAIIRSRGSRGR